MRCADFRQDLRYVYRPAPHRVPRWLQRIWAWF